jgi:hypothetical protein
MRGLHWFWPASSYEDRLIALVIGISILPLIVDLVMVGIFGAKKDTAMGWTSKERQHSEMSTGSWTLEIEGVEGRRRDESWGRENARYDGCVERSGFGSSDSA